MTVGKAIGWLALASVLILFTLRGDPANGCDRWDSDDQLGDLLAVVEHHHPLIVAARELARATGRQRRWHAQARLSYAAKGTTTEAGGVNTMLTVTIPLFDRKREVERAKSQRETSSVSQTIRRDFLKELGVLCTTATTVTELDTQRQFYRDRLKYQQQRVDEGLADAVTLWQYVEKAQSVEYDYQRENGELTARLITVSREYGGDEWKKLQALLAAMLN